MKIGKVKREMQQKTPNKVEGKVRNTKLDLRDNDS